MLITLDARHFAGSGWDIAKHGHRVARHASALAAIRQATVNLPGDVKLHINWQSPPDDLVPQRLHSGQLPVAKFREA